MLEVDLQNRYLKNHRLKSKFSKFNFDLKIFLFTKMWKFRNKIETILAPVLITLLLISSNGITENVESSSFLSCTTKL